MKKILLLATMLCLCVFVSCSKNGDGDKAKLLRAVYGLDDNGNRAYKMSFTYDGQSRLTNLEVSAVNSSTVTSRHTITYSANSIAIKAERQNSSTTKTLNLTDGYVASVTSNGATETYTYNNGYLASIANGDDTENYTWANGNITRIDNMSYTYNSQFNSIGESNVNLNFLTYIDIYEISIFPINLAGISSKNLVTKAAEDEDNYTVNYEFNNDGYPTKAKVYVNGSLDMSLEYVYK